MPTEIQEALYFLMDIAELHYPKYYSCNQIAIINDLLKELYD